MQSVTIGKNQAGQRLDKFLKKYLPEAGTGFLYKMLRKKNITLNGKKAEGKEMLTVGDTVSFFFSEETFLKFTGQTAEPTEQHSEYHNAYNTLKGITVLYEDDNILIVNKPTGILTQKAAPDDLSLNEWLVGYLLHQNSITTTELQSFHPSVCNRLDRNTSGIVLCGKSLEGSQILSKLIKERTVGKFYHTICVGQLQEQKLLEGYLTKNEATNKVTVSNKPLDKEASPIKTAYRPLTVTDNFTLLEVELITGKTHQIRAHLASIGHPIIGDFKYGDAKINKQLQKSFPKLKSQLLHARSIAFPKLENVPRALQGESIIAPYPELFEALIKHFDFTGKRK